MKIILIFAALSLVNVIGSTARSLITVKTESPTVAAFVNAAYFAFYNVVMIYTVANFPLWVKCAVTFGCNLIGVYVVKMWEKKKKPVKMWKIEMALPDTGTRCTIDTYEKWLNEQGIPCNYQKLGHWWIFNCYCDTCEQSEYVNNLCKAENGKISAYESKNL